MSDTYYELLEYEGELETGEIMSFAIKRDFSITRSKVRYDIEIITILNTKRIRIKASDKVRENTFLKILFSLMRFECIYDGCFFPLQKLLFDCENKTREVADILLSFYNGSNIYFPIQQPMDDRIYKRAFCAWEKYDRKNKYLVQMFFYSSFTKGITSDLRMALFSEIFEPLSNILEKDGKVIINNTNPFIVKKQRCPRCQFEYQKNSKRDPSLNDRIMTIIKYYGDNIFCGDDVETIVRKLVNTRNRILHLDIKKKDYLTGKECGFYMKKFVMLYRLIILNECRGVEDESWMSVVDKIKMFDKEFSKLRLERKDSKARNCSI